MGFSLSRTLKKIGNAVGIHNAGDAIAVAAQGTAGKESVEARLKEQALKIIDNGELEARTGLSHIKATTVNDAIAKADAIVRAYAAALRDALNKVQL